MNRSFHISIVSRYLHRTSRVRTSPPVSLLADCCCTKLMVEIAPPDPEFSFAELPEDAMSSIYTLLPAHSLRAAAASNTAWCHALRRAPQAVRSRAGWLHCWTSAGAGASIQHTDSAVCSGDGSWSPGGVALASTLPLSRTQDSGFRLVVEDAAPGDLLMGITLHQPEAAGAAAGGDDGRMSLLEMGYHYIMGRRLGADGSVQISPGVGGVVAPRSIFYGGRSRRCVFAAPTINSSGPTVDTGPDGRSPGKLAKLRHVGDWVEFWLVDGQLSATDHAGHTHAWGVQVEVGEVWVPTLAWTGSRASIRLAPPELSKGRAAPSAGSEPEETRAAAY